MMLKVASVLAAFVATSALADERCATYDGETYDAVTQSYTEGSPCSGAGACLLLDGSGNGEFCEIDPSRFTASQCCDDTGVMCDGNEHKPCPNLPDGGSSYGGGCVDCRRILNQKSNNGFDRKLLMGYMPECCPYENECEQCVEEFVADDGACDCILGECDPVDFIPDGCGGCGEDAYLACLFGLGK